MQPKKIKKLTINKEVIVNLTHQCGRLADELKKAFDCRIVAVVHYSDWGLVIHDNPERLRIILNEEQPDNSGVNLKKSVEKEKTFYSKADHVVSLSHYMHEILCRDYGLDTTKTCIICLT